MLYGLSFRFDLCVPLQHAVAYSLDWTETIDYLLGNMCVLRRAISPAEMSAALMIGKPNCHAYAYTQCEIVKY
jgi:hypothetical protein